MAPHVFVSAGFVETGFAPACVAVTVSARHRNTNTDEAQWAVNRPPEPVWTTLASCPPCHVTFTRTGLVAATKSRAFDNSRSQFFANDTLGAVPALALEAANTEAAQTAMSERFTCSPLSRRRAP